MEDKQIVDLILDRIDALQKTTDRLHRESRDAMTDLKHDMNFRFDNLIKTMTQTADKVDNEREVNIAQNLEIQNLGKQMTMIKDSGDSRLNVLEDEQKKIYERVTRADVRNKIIWSVASGISITSIGIMVKLIFDKIL